MPTENDDADYSSSMAADHVVLFPTMLPTGDFVTFKDTSFFKNHGTDLPAPSEVRRAAGSAWTYKRSPPVIFDSMNLLVKYGSYITAAEGQCLWAINRFLPEVPVPEVYGWCRDGGETFIYMELIPGVTLEQHWGTLDEEGKLSVCEQLRQILASLRRFQQHPLDAFVGHIGRQPLQDIIFDLQQLPVGPFATISSFHTWFALLVNISPSSEPPREHPDFHHLNGEQVTFTHGDLHRSNILISSERRPRVLALVDWHQSGWLPSYWEFCKARWRARMAEDEWESKYLPIIAKPYRRYRYWERYRFWEFCVLRIDT